MVVGALMKYVKEQRRVLVLRVLVRFLEDELTKTEVPTPAIEPFPHPPVADASAPPHPSLTKVCLLTPQRLRACTPQP